MRWGTAVRRRFKAILAAVAVGVGTVGLVAPHASAEELGRTPIGNLELAVSPAAGQIRVAGWTFDPDAPESAAEVHVYVDGRGAALVSANLSRPDVGAAFPGVGANHGFDTTINVAAGSHQVCVYALNYGPVSPNTTLGCRTVTTPSFSPVGAFDTLHFFPDGSPVVYGWAADPEAITQPLDIHVWVDGQRSYAFRTGTNPRPDVTAVTGAPNAGFVGIVPPQGPGVHQICAYAINVGPTGGNTQLGCKNYGAPVAPPPPPPPSIPPKPADRDCPDFSSKAEATDWFWTYYPYYGDFAGLDGDNDGDICESYFG